MSVASKGYRYVRTGPIASVLKLEPFQAVSYNAESDVVLKMTHAPIQRTDAAVINGTALGRQTVTQSSAAPTTIAAPFPRVGGHEGLAVVVDAGRSTRVKSGDAVWVSPTAAAGTWASHIVANGEHVHALPKSLGEKSFPLASCATALITGTQVLARDFAKVNKGDVVIVNGGSSVAALVATARAKQMGATVIAASTAGPRFATAKARLEKAGASAVVEYSAKGARAAAKAAEGKRVAIFANGVGGPCFNDFARLVGAEGACVTYGAQNGYGLMWSGGHQIFNNMTHAGFFAPRFLSKLSYGDRQKAFEDALQFATLEYPMQAVSSLDALPAAWDATYLEGGKKHVLTF